MMWKDRPPFRGAFVYGVGDAQTVELLDPRETFLEALADLDAARKTRGGLDFLRNGDGFSILPSKVRPPPEQRKVK